MKPTVAALLLFACISLACTLPIEQLLDSDKPCATTYEYRPVCADDGQTYQNLGFFKCELRGRKARGGRPVRILHEGECV